MMWRKWDGSGTRKRQFINVETDVIFYFHDFIANAGYQASESNSDIFSLKNRVDCSQGAMWYKTRAIRTFAQDIKLFVQSFPKHLKAALTWIPASKSKDDPLYDDRLKQVADIVVEGMPNILSIETLSTKRTHTPCHKDGHLRDPDYLRSTFVWEDCNLNFFDYIMIIDDILTSGAHFRAMSDMITNKYPSAKICGIFWAATVDQPIEDVFTEFVI